MFRLDNKKALITGAATGLGQMIVAYLAKSGADIVISDKPGINLEETYQKCVTYGKEIFEIDIDVRDLNQISFGIKEIENNFGTIDILVNNAGINIPAPGLDVTLENWEDHFNTNVRGGFFVPKQLLKK